MNFIEEVTEILKKCALMQEQSVLSPEKEFIDFLEASFDYFERLMVEDPNQSMAKTICHNFLDQWLDDANHNFKNLYNIKKDEWPRIARNLAKELEKYGDIKADFFHKTFIVKN